MQLAAAKIAKYGEPLRVSPLIKFSRYAALFLGITYGFYRNKFLQRRADKFKTRRDARKAARLEEERIKAEQVALENLKTLETNFGTKIM